MNQPNKPLIIIVEDSLYDFEVFDRVAKKHVPELNLVHYRTSDELVHAIDQNLIVQFKPVPQFILLDLNLPGCGGLKLLEKLKQDHNLKRIPVIVWTTSPDPKDIDRAVQLQANSYLIKPVNYKALVSSVRHMLDYWSTDRLRG